MENRELAEQLVSKSIEAFIMGLEVYNKPTIRYRIEGFSFFITNAWELMLKAKLLNDGVSIYFKNNHDRTLSLNEVITKVFPDKKQPLRLNLEKIVVLRNTSTHFITEDYETVYAPLFQSNVLSFGEQLQRFHQHDITQDIPQNFLTLSATMAPLTDEQIKLKYAPEIAERLIFQKDDIATTSALNPTDKFTIDIVHYLYQVKGKDTADFTFKIAAEGEVPVKTITRRKNPAETHMYSHNDLVNEIMRRIRKQKINFEYRSKERIRRDFTSSLLTLFMNFYDMKADDKYAFKHVIGNRERYSYSQAAAEFVVSEIKKDPQNIIANLKKAKLKR
ncbi:DUF3644 domain-containing protein [Weissella soli]|uniref:DUF3644 domain-containing protein n=2 Tax=Weissella soli TaxID=155866 RepID=UPI0011BB5CFD|nr:DUF3644 domain-containing protein [Weissella soli]QEA35213.1 DUF3644 domain-containing protein [Weissella soli]